MAVRNGTSHVVAAAGQRGPGLLFGLGGADWLSQAAQWLFLTSLFAAALAFHNVVWRGLYAPGRGSVLPPALGRPRGHHNPQNPPPRQSAARPAVIVGRAAAG